MMSSFVDQQFILIGPHRRNARDLSPGGSPSCAGVSIGREHDDLEQRMEAKAGEEVRGGGMRRPVNLDLGCRFELESSSIASRTIRQLSCTSDLDVTPSTELSTWHDLHLAAEDGGWTEEGMKQWTDPLTGTMGFEDANHSIDARLNSYERQNNGVAERERGGVGRGERRGGGRDNDVGSDSDSGKGTVSDCRQSPTEEISFQESPLAEACKQSLCRDDLETISENGSATIEASSVSSLEQRKSERTVEDESDCLAGVPGLKDLKRFRDPTLTMHYYSDHNCYPVLPDSSLEAKNHLERSSKVDRYPVGERSFVEEQNVITPGFAGDKEFSDDVLRTYGVIDSNNNYSFEVSSQSRVENSRCKIDTSHEFKGAPNRTKPCETDDGVFDASHDVVSSRRELQAKCQDMFGSRPSILGSQDVHSRLGSRLNLHDSRNYINDSYRDIPHRYEVQHICRDAYDNRDEIRDVLYDVCDTNRDVYDSCRGVDRSFDASSSGRDYHLHDRGFHAGFRNNAYAMQGSLNGFSAHDEFTHASHDSIHDHRQRDIGSNRGCPSLSNSPSKISAEYSFGSVQGDLSSTPVRRYYRREPLTPLGPGASRNSPQKGHHRYTRKNTDGCYVIPTVSDSDPEIYHEEFDRGFSASQGNITPAQYRRIRSVPHDRGLAGPLRVLGSAHPALQQPFSDEEPATLPRPAKPGRSAVGSLAAERQVNSCGKTEDKGNRQRPHRRWTNLGLSAAEPGVEESGQKVKTPWGQSAARFRVPSFFKSRKNSTSTTSVGTVSGTTAGTVSGTTTGTVSGTTARTVSGTTTGTGTPVIHGSTAGGGARIRSDCETGSKARCSSSGNAAESGFETGSSMGSAGDISGWSMSLRSTQSVFDSAETPLPVEDADTGIDQFRRSISAPNPDGKCRSSVSLLDRLRARLTPRKKSSSAKDKADHKMTSPSKDGPNPRQNHEEIQLSVFPLFNSQDTDARRRRQMDGDGTDRCDESSMATVAMTNASMTTTFETCTPTNSEEIAIRKVYATDSIASSPSSSAATSSPAAVPVPQTTAKHESFLSKILDGRMIQNKATPSEGCFNAVAEMIDTLDQLIDLVDSSITSAPSSERTITEVEFKEHRSRMIDSVKEFNQACKHMVIKTPDSEPAFLEALNGCRWSLDDVAGKYSALVDCASLPTDRSKVANPVISVANSLKETVKVAFRVTGCSARDPVMIALRRSANKLVYDLGLLMKSVREMNYNRLSRRF